MNLLPYHDLAKGKYRKMKRKYSARKVFSRPSHERMVEIQELFRQYYETKIEADNMEERGMNQRIQKLRRQSMIAEPHLSIERSNPSNRNL